MAAGRAGAIVLSKDDAPATRLGAARASQSQASVAAEIAAYAVSRTTAFS